MGANERIRLGGIGPGDRGSGRLTTAEKLGAPYMEMDTGHYPMLSAPDELTKLLG